MQATQQENAHPIRRAVRATTSSLAAVAMVSGVINILMLAGPLYMLQVYDRVLASQSVPTLVGITVFLVGAYAFQAAFDTLRTRIVVRSGLLLETRLSSYVNRTAQQLAAKGRRAGEVSLPVRDLDNVRTFMTSGGPTALVDLPWLPVFLVVCYLIHPSIGLLSLGSGLLLFALAFATERSSRDPARMITSLQGQRLATLDAAARSYESIAAMGLQPALMTRWQRIENEFLHWTRAGADAIAVFGGLSRVTRLLAQSGVYGLGAYLVINGELSPGAMIAASVMLGRALAPIETTIGNWRSFVAARQSFARLTSTLSAETATVTKLALPAPSRQLTVEKVGTQVPGTDRWVLRNINFRAAAGEALGIVGPSGAGKSSLLRALLGIWPAQAGVVRLDGSDIRHWDPDRLGPSIGYMSQTLDLFEGTISENIARMATEPDPERVIRAAEQAGAHAMIQHLPQGYNTPVSDGGASLSGGQRQRIALARALYGQPFLIVLDEPNAYLDSDGEAALQEAIRAAKARGAIVLLAAHRPSALTNCDKVLYIANGTQHAFGPSAQVLEQILERPVELRRRGATEKVLREELADERDRA